MASDVLGIVITTLRRKTLFANEARDQYAFAASVGLAAEPSWSPFPGGVTSTFGSMGWEAPVVPAAGLPALNSTCGGLAAPGFNIEILIKLVGRLNSVGSGPEIAASGAKALIASPTASGTGVFTGLSSNVDVAISGYIVKGTAIPL
jgi:hypothetical protein